MTNDEIFMELSGQTKLTNWDLASINFTGQTVTKPIPLTTVNNVGTFNRTPKEGPLKTPSDGPVYKTGETQTLNATLMSLPNPLMLNETTLPFTAGTVDYSFPAGGGVEVDGFNGPVYAIKVDSDGKYLVGGDFGHYYNNGQDYYSPYLIRLNPDGSKDQTFDVTQGWDCWWGGSFDGTVYTIEIQPDGKILVGGAFTHYDVNGNCNNFNGIIRLNPDATIDSTFNTGNGFDNDVNYIALQPDGKILVGGYFTTFNDIYAAYRIIRLNSNGSVDSSFLIGNGDVSFNDYVNVIKIQTDGKIIVGGYFTSYGFVTQNKITRLNSDGSLDTTFQIGNGFSESNSDEVLSIATQSNGKIIVGGYLSYFDNNNLYAGGIVRLNTNGTLDTIFEHGLDGGVHSLAIQSDDKIIAGGYITDYYDINNNVINIDYIVRFHSDCSLDYSFSFNSVLNEAVESIVILEDNNILVGGSFNNNGGDPSINPLNYFGRLYNSISIYPYTYTVYVCAQPIPQDTTYVVGSMVPLNGDYTYSFQSIQKPSVTVCGTISETLPSNVVDYFMVNTYNDCAEAISGNSKYVLIQDNTFGYDNTYEFFVDNKYQVGDVIYVDMVIDNYLNNFTPWGDASYYKFAGTIIEELTFDYESFPLYFLLPSVDYSPYASVNDAIQDNGVHYYVSSCTEEEFKFSLIHKQYNNNVSILQPTGNNTSKQIIDYYGYGPYYWISEGTPEIYSTIEFNDCTEALTYASKSGFLSYDFGTGVFDGNSVFDTLELPDGKILVGGDFYRYYDRDVNYFVKINSNGKIDTTFNSIFSNSPTWSTETPFNTVVTARFIRWTITRRRDVSDAVQASEFTLYCNGEPVNWSGSATVNNPGGDNPIGEDASNLIDGDLETKWTDLNFWVNGGENADETYGQSVIEIFNDDYITFDSYSWATANDFSERDAISWVVEVSLDNSNWTTISQVTNGDITEDRETYIGEILSDKSVNPSGSIYFDGTPLCSLSADTSNGSWWDLANNNLTFEWYQFFTGDITTNPVAFSYLGNDLMVYFSEGTVNVVIDGDLYDFNLDTTIENEWCHIALTRYYDGDDYIWRIFQNGIKVGQFYYSYSFNQSQPLAIGNDLTTYNDRNAFKGYITNFRVTNLEAIYTSDFTVPTSPLNPNYNAGGGNVVLCLSVLFEDVFIDDSCDDNTYTWINEPNYYLYPGFDGYVRAIALQPDGKILVGGDFNYYNNEFAGKIIRLNPDGSIDQDFTYYSEFNGTVRTIAIQNDGKILVGGDFDYYYDYFCNHIIRLNSDGTPDETFITNDGFDGGIYTITTEYYRNPTSFFITPNPYTYTENIIVGGWFSNYNGLHSAGIAKLSNSGEWLPDFNAGFNQDSGTTPAVKQIVKQPDGKLIVIGGDEGEGFLFDYNYQWIPQNIVRLVKDADGVYQIDDTFTTRDFDNGGGFDGPVLSASILPNGKIMIGGEFDGYNDNNNNNTNTGYLIRLNPDGTYDDTFTFKIVDNYVNKIEYLSNSVLLVGGDFSESEFLNKLIELYIGESYELRSFETCDGISSNIIIPAGYVGDTLLDLIPTPLDPDDSNYVVTLPLPFDVNFLNTNYTQVNVSTNSYITFGEGGHPDNCCFYIPNDISEVGLPGVYISTSDGDGSSMDDFLINLYSGLTDNGNTMVIRYEGTYLSFVDNNDVPYDNAPPLVYNFKFYKDNSDYFDLIIESNTYFSDNDTTGGTSDGNNSFIGTFDSSSNNSYRIYSDGSVESLTYSPFINVKPIRANIDDRNVVCGKVGDVITTPNTLGDGIGGSMYFDGTSNTVVTVDYDIDMDLDHESWTIEWFQKYTSTDTCCRRIFDIGTFPNEHIGASIENNDSIALWIDGNSGNGIFYTLNTPVKDVWCHFAITAKDIGGDQRIIRLFQNGVQLGEDYTTDVDFDNFDPGNVQLPLIIGGMGNGGDTFQGYITNFRWTKGKDEYLSSPFTVPPTPLNVANSQLLLLATDENNLIYDSTETKHVTQNNVVWSNENPFKTIFNLYTTTNTTSYNSCSECESNVYYETTLYSVDGVNPNYITRARISKSDIQRIMTLGPIFKYKKPIAYEVLNYKL